MKKTTKGISCVALDRIERIKAVKGAEEEEEEEEEENGPLSTPARLVVQPVGSQDVVLVTGPCCLRHLLYQR
jgi:CRISPR/Cas system CMR subunit Cmr4 (Cas7 group RAMP superfamily)